LVTVTAACTAAAQTGTSVGGQDLVISDPAEGEFLFRAEQLLIAECMREDGFPWVAAPPIPTAPYATTDRRGYERWGWTDAALARDSGYGIERSLEFNESLRQSIESDTEFQEFEQWLLSLSEADGQRVYAALEGSNQAVVVEGVDGSTWTAATDGCRSESLAAIYGSVEDYLKLEAYRSRVGNGGRGEVDEDGEYQQVEQQWSDCMRERGFDYETPGDAYDDVFARYESEPGLEQEVAIGEAECNRAVALEAAGEAALARVQESLLRELGPATAEIREILARSVSRAKSLLDE
jgi:hypothetical protein